MSDPGGRSRSSGFSLVEALVALAILALVLLLGFGLLWQQRRLLVRLEARETAEQAVAEALEVLRAGTLPLVSGPVPVSATSPSVEESDGLWVVVRVVPAEPPAGLYRGQVLARCTVRGQTVIRTVDTQFWRPDMLRSR